VIREADPYQKKAASKGNETHLVPKSLVKKHFQKR
jgi:hypothetical protein